jgi:hypothetical protein
MEPKIQKLTNRVKELSELLSEYGEFGWAGFLKNCNEYIVSGDEYGLQELNEVIHKMGSFNDIIITQKKGTPLEPMEIIEVNEKLTSLNSEIFSRLIDLQIKE